MWSDSRKLRWAFTAGLTVLLLASGPARANISWTTPIFYDTGQLAPTDWEALGLEFSKQARGTQALIFPGSKRAPITDPAAIARYVKDPTKPFLGASFPGVNGDPLAAWALAKQFANANHETGGPERPVLAVHSGWTDFGAAVGHLYEWQGLRDAVETGSASPGMVSLPVAKLLIERQKAQRAHDRQNNTHSPPLLVGGHSAGNGYVGNVVKLIHEAGDGLIKGIRVQTFGMPVELPTAVKAIQIAGLEDAVALSNTTKEALLDPRTRLVPGLAHAGGAFWTLADTIADHPWVIEPLTHYFPLDGQRGHDEDPVALLRQRADHHKDRAVEHHAVANAYRDKPGSKSQLYQAKFDNVARKVELRRAREQALADALTARAAGAKTDLQRARSKLAKNRNDRRALQGELQQRTRYIPKNVFTDVGDFTAQMLVESMGSATAFTPWLKGANAMMLNAAHAMHLGQLSQANVFAAGNEGLMIQKDVLTNPTPWGMGLAWFNAGVRMMDTAGSATLHWWGSTLQGTADASSATMQAALGMPREVESHLRVLANPTELMAMVQKGGTQLQHTLELGQRVFLRSHNLLPRKPHQRKAIVSKHTRN